MSYTIYYSDPAKFSYPIVVQDNTKYNGVGTGGLTLVGRNYPGYGQVVAEDLIHILENSASTVPPINPIEGQLWYDSRTKKLRINDGAANNANWKPINGLFQQETEPTNVITGDIWVDTLNMLVYVYNGTAFVLVGIQNSSGNNGTGAIPVTVEDIAGNLHGLILNTVSDAVDGTAVISVVAQSSFTPKVTIAGFTTLVSGVNINSNSILNGTADSATYLRQNGERVIGASFMRKDLSQSLNGQLSIANDSNALKIGTDPTFIIERLNSGAVANFVNTYNSNGSFSFNMKNSNFGNVPILTMGGIDGRVTIFSTSTNALSVSGSAVFGGSVTLDGNLTFTSSANTLTVANIVITSSTQAISTSTGSLVVKGGVAIGKNLHVGGSFYAYDKFFANSTLGGITTGTSGQILVAGDNGFAYWRSISTSSYQGGAVPGAVSIGETTNSTATTNGSLIVAGGVGIAKDVYIGGGVTATSITIGSTVITTASIRTSVTVAVNSTASSTSTTTGALTVAGGVGIAGNLNVGGEIIASKLTIQLTTVTTTLVTTDDVIRTTNATASTGTASGALQITGGAGIGGAVYAGSLYDVSRRVVTTLVSGTGTQAVRSGLTTATINLLPPTTSVIGGVKTSTGTPFGVYDWVGSTGTLTTGTTINIDSEGVIAVNTNTLMTTSTFARFVSTPATVAGAYLGGVRAGGKYVDVSLINGQMSVLLTPGAGIGITESPASGNAGISGSITLNTATTIARGGVIVPEYATSYIYLSANGSIRVDPPYVLVTATNTTLGGVKIGEGIFVDSSGTISVNTLTSVPIANTATLGGFVIDSAQPTIEVSPDSGVVYLNINFATTQGLSLNYNWNIVDNAYDLNYSLLTATNTVLGGVKIGNGFAVSNDGTINVTTASYTLSTATASLVGGVKIGANILAAGDGTISVAAPYVLTTATASALGGVKVGSNISVAGDGTISVATPYVLTTATASAVGGVKIGANVNIAGDGTISVATPYSLNTATASTLGGIKIGSNLSITGDGTLSANITPAYTLTTATDLALGGVILGTTVLADSLGTLNVNTSTLLVASAVTATTARFVSTTATSAQLGGIKLGGNLLATGDGTVTFNTATLVTTATTAQFVSTTATNSQLGAVIIGSGFVSLGDGTISVNTNTQVAFAASATTATTAQFISTTATAAVLGGIRIGAGLAATGAGVVSVNTASFTYTLPAATSGVLGGVKIGANINVTPDGTISITPGAYTLTTATAIALGGVKIGANITAAGDGTISVAAPYSLPIANAGTLGGVRIGNGISIDGSGVISVNTGSNYVLTTATTATIGGIVGLVDTKIALGFQAGYTQGADAIAIGNTAGTDNQGASAIAIGLEAGRTSQGTSTVAIGLGAGNANQSRYGIALGDTAGSSGQGEFAVAIGAFAGATSQPANSIIINATGTTFNAATASAFYVNPIRSAATTTNALYYNGTTKEVSYGPAAFVSGGTMNGALVVNNATNATSTATGALQINNGGAGIGGNIYAGGNLNIVGVSTLTGNTLVSGSLGVNTNFVVTGTTTIGTLNASQGVFSGNLGITGTVTVTAGTVINAVTQASSTSTGALQVKGGAAIGGDIWLGGNLILGTASRGINFSVNTNAAGMTSEVLSDYEEGTWTPVLTAATPPTGASLTIGGAAYTKIGNYAFVCCDVTVANTGTGGAGIVTITGLPFVSKTWGGYNPTSCETESLTSNIATVIQPLINQNTSKVDFYYGWNNTTGPTSFQYSLLQVGTIIRLTGYYLTA